MPVAPTRPQPPPPAGPQQRVVIVMQQQQQGPGRRHFAAELAAFGGALIMTLAQFLLFVNAFGELNQSEPRVDNARAAATASLIAGVVAVALAAWASYLRKAHPLPAALGGFIGLLVGGGLASQLPDSFGLFGELGWMFSELFILGILLAPLIVFLVMIFGEHQRVAWGIGLGLILFHALAYVSLASYFLSNLEPLADAAREANESPGLAFALLIAAAATVALVRRRRLT